MQALQQEPDTTLGGGRDFDRVFRTSAATSVQIYAEEVRALRQRVAELEAELAAAKAQAKAAPTSEPVSEFCSPDAPAVVAVLPSGPADTRAPETRPTGAVDASETVSNPGFAYAWIEEDAATSFEERIAEKAFFQASTVDEESRSWLLTQ